MAAAAGPVLSNYSSIAVNYFTSTRVPAALIAGSSLGALFIMVKQTKDREERNSSKLRWVVLFLYHCLSLTSLCLSLNVIVTATTASNSLLVGEHNPMAASALEFLRREVNYEYLTTKWCFYASIVCFLNAVACRALIEFDLLRKERIRQACLVVFSILALVGHILHLMNDALYLYPNLWVMTIALGKVRTIILLSLSFPKVYLPRQEIVIILPPTPRPSCCWTWYMIAVLLAIPRTRLDKNLSDVASFFWVSCRCLGFWAICAC